MTTRTLAHRLPVIRIGAVLAVVAVAGIAVVGGIGTAMTGSTLGVVGGAALLLGAILVLRPQLGVVLFLLLLWMNVPAVLVDYQGVPSFVVDATVLLLLVPVARALLQREPVIVTPAFVAMLIFVAANLLSAATSTNPGLAAETVTTVLAEGLLVYVLVSNAVRTVSMARLAIVILVISSAAMGAIAVHQELTGAYRNPYLGFAQNTLQDDTELPDPNGTVRPRMEGPVGEKNRFAQVLLVVLPLALFGIHVRRRMWVRVAQAMTAVLILAGIFLTYSRGAAVALGLLAAVLVVRRYVRLGHMLALIAAFSLTVVIVAPDFVARVGSLGAVAGWVSGEGEDPDGAVIGRATSNIAALLVFVDHPLTGVGPGVYAEDYSQRYANRLGLRYFIEERRAHNMYVEWAAELGIGGLAAGVALIAISMTQRAGLRAYWLSRRRDHADLAGAFYLALLAYAGSAVFLHLSYMRYFFTLLALANAVIWILQRERERFEAGEVLMASAPINATPASSAGVLPHSPVDAPTGA
jgi:O-antigen ligase